MFKEKKRPFYSVGLGVVYINDCMPAAARILNIPNPLILEKRW